MHELAFTNNHPTQYSYPPDAYYPPPAAASPPPQGQQLGYHHPGLQDQAFTTPHHPPPDGLNYYSPPPPASQQQLQLQQQSQHQLQHQPYAAASVELPPHAFASPHLTGQQSASPAPHFSPDVGGQRQASFSSSAPPTQSPMAAPPLPPSPTNAQPTNQAAAPTSPAPSSPSAAPSGREAQRMTLLLEINQELLAEVQRLQGEEQGGATSAQHQMQLRQAGHSDKMASDDYIQLLRRLQGNLAYMMPRSGQPTNPDARVIAGPAFMQPPPQMPQLADKYEKLRELFPQWPGNDAKLMAMSAGGSAGSPTQQQSMQQRQMQQLLQQQQQQQQQQQSNANGFAPPGPNMMQ